MAGARRRAAPSATLVIGFVRLSSFVSFLASGAELSVAELQTGREGHQLWNPRRLHARPLLDPDSRFHPRRNRLNHSTMNWRRMT